MFDSPLDFFSLVIAIVAFIFARKAFNQTAALRARLDLMETVASSAARGQRHAATTPRAGSADRAIGSGPDQN